MQFCVLMYMELSLLFLLLFLPSSSLVLQTQPCPSRLVLFCILACFFYKMCCTKLSSQGDLFPSPWDPSSCSWSPAVWQWPGSFLSPAQALGLNSSSWLGALLPELHQGLFPLMFSGFTELNMWMWEGGMEAPHLQPFHYFCAWFCPYFSST